MDSLEWLQKWYSKQCDGDWEHTYGMSIKTLDNPGWELTINLEETSLEQIGFKPVKVEDSECNWIACRVDSKKFLGYGGPENLGDLIDTFRRWVELTETV
jgi:hypothetical protein